MVMSLLDDVVFHIPGRSQQSGDRGGSYFSKVGGLSGGTHRLEIRDVLANDEHTVTVLRARLSGITKSSNTNMRQLLR